MPTQVALLDLRVPGRVLHVWARRGIYCASPVARDCPSLAHIQLYGNMLADHGAGKSSLHLYPV
jgi:hypothetical protein